MAALDDGSLLIQYGDLYVGDDAGSLVNVGAVRNVKFMAGQTRTKVESDNRGTIINKIRLQGKVEAELLEAGKMSVLDNIFKGLVELNGTAGSPVSGEEQVISAGQWLFNKFIPLTGQNGDGTVQTINSVVSGTDGALSAGTDYVSAQDPSSGEWGILVIEGGAASTEDQQITVDLDYTPNANVTLTGGTNQTATPRYVRIIGPSEDDAGVTRTVDLEEAVASSDMLIPFVDVENANDVGVMPVTFESNKGTAWTITDEINP